ncbi:STAS domain-containing protein [Bdellovibrio sp. 22V]|uniref:STAS domain-containing protein n=1 Tax=Bdellovibrio TaxID=958 RepID=UPI0025439DB9|nr:STAS domain-containing protein [Bdellovibrio sp. 22V]WII71510.1 STAS domain-containing protein [Bdellovibrio sp. 22V]
MEEQKSFHYNFNQKNNMLVISLIGEITPQVIPSLEACRQELLAKSEVSRVVLYFQDVETISMDAIPILAQIQREIRSKPADLRLCSLKESLREKLVRMGVVRGLEVADDLKTALLSFGRAA